MMLKVFVTGGTGFLGKYLLEELSKDSRIGQVTALRRKMLASPGPNSVHWIQGDLRHPESWIENLKEADYIFHLGANASFGSGIDYEVDNSEPLAKMIEVLKSAPRLKNFIFVSTVGAFDRTPNDRCQLPLTIDHVPHPRSDYGRSKLNAESLLLNSGLRFTIVRPTWIYGKGMRPESHLRVLAKMVKGGALATQIGWPGQVGVVHAKDLAQQLVRCLDNEAVLGRAFFAATENLDFKVIFRRLGVRRQIPAPLLSTIGQRIHSKLPVTLAMLLLPYLSAEGRSWEAVTQPGRILFSEGAQEILDEGEGRGGFRVITGANSGIGLELARLWKDHNLILIDKNVDVVSREFPETPVWRCDLADYSERSTVIEKLRQRPLNVIVNNAGVGVKGTTGEVSAVQMEKMISVNMTAPMALVHSLASELRSTGTTIVNVTSSVAFNPLPGMSAYAATKAGLQSWSEALAVEWKSSNVVITMAPSGTRTGFQGSAGVKAEASQKLLSPVAVAERISHAVLKAKSVLILPQGRPRILLLITHFLPRSWRAALWGFLFKKAR